MRPWGEELWITREVPSMVKVITVKPGEMCSLQYHHNRDEFWHIISGNGVAVIGDQRVELGSDVDVFIPRLTHHRFEGGTLPLVILELTFGDFNEEDIVRLEDKYGRT